MYELKKQARLIRLLRWLHRKIAVALFIFFFIISVTGILLGLKKNTGLLAPTQKGVSSNAADWLPLDSLTRLAVHYLRDSVSEYYSPAIDRIDIRPQKGIAKFIFRGHFKGLQLDCTTGELLLIETRKSDFIEKIHDGSLFDRIFNTPGEEIKLGYTFIMGMSLLMLVLSGFWLWYGPKKLRKQKKTVSHPKGQR
jgi:uncharacterized iron-regulated membrane protein